MKKKGLIISTVVMVVVLIASLTTATYAWFSASQRTEISGFNVSVVSSNAVNIGMKKVYGFADTATPDLFATGDVTFSVTGTESTGAGKVDKPGEWTGTGDGFSATLNHNINWGSQKQAVGVTDEEGVTAANVQTKTNINNTTYWVNHTTNKGVVTYLNSNEGKKTVVAANKAQGESKLVEQKLARANIGENDGEAGDYAHFILGVQPTKALSRNNFVIMVSPTTSTSTLGVLASIHVAYRTKMDGQTASAWTEVDLYQNNHATTTVANVSNAGVTDDVSNAYKTTYGTSQTVPTGSAAVVINNLDTQINKVTQIEVVIYMSGADSDCTDSGKTASGEVKMFFDSVNEQTQATSAKLIADNKLEIEGGETTYTATNTTVKIGEETIAGTWTNGKFTSAGTVTATAGTTKVVVQTQGKDAKELTIQAVGG